MNVRLPHSIAGTVLALTLFAGTAAQAATVVNGGFEAGDFTGWTQFGNFDFTGVDTLSPQSGNYAGYFGPSSVPGAGQPTGGPGGIAQTLATVVGASYTVDFWLKNEGGPSNAFSVSWGGSEVTALSLADAPVFDYQHYSFTQNATSTATTLAFSFRHDTAVWDLDNVSAVPEPASMALMAAGLFTVLAARRRRRA